MAFGYRTVLTIRLPDMSVNRMPTVVQFWNPLSRIQMVRTLDAKRLLNLSADQNQEFVIRVTTMFIIESSLYPLQPPVRY